MFRIGLITGGFHSVSGKRALVTLRTLRDGRAARFSCHAPDWAHDGQLSLRLGERALVTLRTLRDGRFPYDCEQIHMGAATMNLFSAPVQAPCSGRCALLAGMAGLEPANAGVKVPCLTTWLHPNISEARAGADAPALSHSMGWVMGLEPTTPGTTIRCSAN